MTKPNSILRPGDIFGPGNPLPIGHTKFWEDFVYQPGGSEFVTGTDIKRLKLVRLGERAVGAFADEVYQLVEALRSWRDMHPEKPRRIAHEHAVKGGRATAAKRKRAASTNKSAAPRALS
jgi:hypothetical protein